MRLIDADALKDMLKKLVRDGVNINYDIDGTIDRAVTITPERNTGRWIHKGGGSFICSDCGEMVGLNTYRSERAGEIFLYCPHCGVRMKGDENETG